MRRLEDLSWKILLGVLRNHHLFLWVLLQRCNFFISSEDGQNDAYFEHDGKVYVQFKVLKGESVKKKIHLVSLKLRRKGKDSYIFLTNNVPIYS